MNKLKIRADFNGLFSDEGETLLCLSHGEPRKDEFGNDVFLTDGIELTAFDEDYDENDNRDDLIANGFVEHSPDWLQCKGSKWVLRIDSDGIYNKSEKL